jgi:hypothetical protein
MKVRCEQFVRVCSSVSDFQNPGESAGVCIRKVETNEVENQIAPIRI